MKPFNILFFVFALIFSSCSRHSKEVESALLLAGENRSELEQVLKHFSGLPADSKKLRAAEYLVKNIAYHQHYTGEGVDWYYRKADSLFTLGIINVPDMQEQLNALRGRATARTVSFAFDREHIDASFLISRIEQAFSTEKYPWSSRLSFHDFCDYILPYRLYNEPPEDWWSDCSVRFAPVIDSLLRTGTASDSAICRHINDTWTKPVRYKYVRSTYDLPYTVLSKMTNGTCYELVQMGVYIMRSFGIPVVCDFTPQWANRHDGHQWNSLLYNGRVIPFVFGEPGDFGEHISKRVDKAAKIYRKTFSIQKETLVMQKFDEEIPPFFRSPFIKDVSEMYFTTSDVMVELTMPPTTKKKIAYIMVFDNNNWVPIHWGLIKNNKAFFTKMAEGCAYTVMYYDDNRFYPASQAFYINSGTVHYFEPDLGQLEDIVLKRKYPEMGSRVFKEYMVAGEFQGSNRPDFSDAVLIHRIDSTPESSYNFVDLETPCCFRYFRYMPPVGKNSYTGVAGIEFYDETGQHVQGKIIGTDGSFDDLGNDKYKVFDGNTLTYFDAPEPDGGWVGMDMNKTTCLKRIVYLPRNDDNFIREGELYELFYWNRFEWLPLGRQTGGSREIQKLAYCDVPKNALFLLRNLTKGKEERPFTYENGKQIWW